MGAKVVVMPGLKIGDLAVRTGTSAPTIRYYEQIGLLPNPDRQSGNQRRYGAVDVSRLTFIRRCREFGFSIEQVREMASLAKDSASSCSQARDLAAARLDDIRQKLKELRQLERSIANLVEGCDAGCLGGPSPSCSIIQEFAETPKAASGPR